MGWVESMSEGEFDVNAWVEELNLPVDQQDLAKRWLMEEEFRTAEAIRGILLLEPEDFEGSGLSEQTLKRIHDGACRGYSSLIELIAFFLLTRLFILLLAFRPFALELHIREIMKHEAYSQEIVSAVFERIDFSMFWYNGTLKLKENAT